MAGLGFCQSGERQSCSLFTSDSLVTSSTTRRLGYRKSELQSVSLSSPVLVSSVCTSVPGHWNREIFDWEYEYEYVLVHLKEGRVRVRVRTRSLERRSSTSTSTYSFTGTWSSTSTGTSTSTYSSTLASKFALFGLESLTIFSHELWILSREIFQVFPGEQSHVVLARLCCLFLLCCDWLQRKYRCD
jgi:hypothetical protein